MIPGARACSHHRAVPHQPANLSERRGPAFQLDVALPQSSLQWMVVAYGPMFSGFSSWEGRWPISLARAGSS